jgi:hypothetical protein
MLENRLLYGEYELILGQKCLSIVFNVCQCSFIELRYVLACVII